MDKESYTKAVRDYLEKNWTGEKVCPICKKNSWALPDSMGMIQQIAAGAGIRIGGPYYPLIPITCLSCGYTILLNAKIAGLTAPDDTPAQSTEIVKAAARAMGGDLDDARGEKK